MSFYTTESNGYLPTRWLNSQQCEEKVKLNLSLK